MTVCRDTTEQTCARKVAHASKRVAKAQARKIMANGGSRVEAYRCPHCDCWHTGHVPDYLR